MNASWRQHIDDAQQQVEDLERAGSCDETENIADDVVTPAREAQPSLPHDIFPDFEILRELHRGGQGIVYQAIEKGTERKVAIKVLLEGRFASASARQRFDREIKLASRLKHPNIITVLRSGETTGGQPFYVMDYVRGQPLEKFVREHQLELKQTLELFATVCRAVSHAHQKGVIHRDLKPSNILVEVDGAPKVLDFGLAKLLAGPEQVAQTLTGAPLGTLAYMSPEQVRGNPDEIDTRVDVYALGVILYQALTGTFPYPVHVAVAEVLHHITDSAPRPPSQVLKKSRSEQLSPQSSQPATLDDEVETMILKALSKEPDRRYQFAGEFARDIERYLAGEPIEAKGDSLGYKLKKTIGKYRLATAAVAGCFALITFGLVFALWALRSVQTARQQETKQRRMVEIQESVLRDKQDAYRRGMNELIKAVQELLGGSSIDVESRMRLGKALGQTYREVSDFGNAESYLQDALKLADGPDSQSIQLKYDLAQVHILGGEPQRAERLLREVVEWRRANLETNDWKTLRAQNDLALSLSNQERFDEAIQLYEQVLAAHRAADRNASVATLLNNVAAAHYKQKNYAPAAELLEESFHLRQQLLDAVPADNVKQRADLEARMLSVKNNLGGIYTMLGELDRAEALLQDALDRARVTLPSGHSDLGPYLTYYGRLQLKQQRFREAEVALLESLEIHSRHFGNDNEWTREVVDLLIELYTAWSKPDEAKQLYRRLSA